MVGSKGPDRVASVRDEHKQPLHPLGVLLERLQVGERFRLGDEARVWLTVDAALGPAFARFAGVEKGSCRFSDGLGGGGHVTPLSWSRWGPRCWTEMSGRWTRFLTPSVQRLYAWPPPRRSSSGADHGEGTGGTSLNISSHNSRHWSQIRESPADAMAAT